MCSTLLGWTKFEEAQRYMFYFQKARRNERTLFRLASMETVSPNLPRHTSMSCNCATALGSRVRLQVGMFEVLSQDISERLNGCWQIEARLVYVIGYSRWQRVGGTVTSNKRVHPFYGIYHNRLAMAVTLPHDILHLICVELGHQRDFNSLFYIAVSSKQLAQSAVPNLYRCANTLWKNVE